MNDKNKNEFAFFAKMAFLFVWGMLTIVTFAGVLNYCPEAFVKWCAGIVFAMNGIIIWRYARRLVKEHDEAKPQKPSGTSVTEKPEKPSKEETNLK